jgi:hypothetical protein
LLVTGTVSSRTCCSSSVRAVPGRLSVLSVFLLQSILCGAFVWARRALNGPKRRFPARADEASDCLTARRPGCSIDDRCQDIHPLRYLRALQRWRSEGFQWQQQSAEGCVSRPMRCQCYPLVQLQLTRGLPMSEKDSKLTQKLAQLQPFTAVFPQECVGQLAPSGPD